MRYPAERREAILKKMLPPHNRSMGELAKEEGVSEGTLYNWRKAARMTGRLLPDGDTTPAGRGSADKFAAVLETVAMNEAELSEYCRRRGLYPEQIRAWREACEQANDRDRTRNQRLQESRKADQLRIRTLTRELERKEKALAEAAQGEFVLAQKLRPAEFLD